MADFRKTTATKKIIAARKTNKRLLGIPGGTSAGKTIAVLMFLIAKAQSDKTPTLTSVVSESVPHLKRGAIRDFKNILTTQYRDWETDRKSTRLNSSHSGEPRMPSSA